jgi:hypothetical protein
MSLSDVSEVLNKCQRRRYEYRISEKDFNEKNCKKLGCFKDCSVSEYMENLELNGFLKTRIKKG